MGHVGLRAAGITTLLAVGLAACGDSGSSSSTTAGAAGAASSGGGRAVAVTAQGFKFSTPVTVASGGAVTVTFTNKDAAEHSLTLDDNSASVDVDGGKSGTLALTLPASGTVAFHCKYHASMHGQFVVGGGSSGAGGSTGSSSSGGYGY